MISKVNYKFAEKPWKHSSPGGWYFISLPKEISKEIRDTFKAEEEGWGRLKVLVKIGKNEWKTAIWFDTKRNTYFLPLKSEIRKSENIEIGKIINVSIWI